MESANLIGWIFMMNTQPNSLVPLLTTSSATPSATGSQPATAEQNPVMAIGRRCSFYHHEMNVLILKARGWKAALLRASKTGDVAMIDHVVLNLSDQTEVLSSSKNQTPLMKAIIHDQPEACKRLLELGAKTEELCHSIEERHWHWNWKRFAMTKKCVIPIGYCSLRTLQILLDGHRINPNQGVIKFCPCWESMTLLEFHNLEARSSMDKSNQCLLLAKDPRTDLNMYSDFYMERRRAYRYISKSSYKIFTHMFGRLTGAFRLSLLSQAILFNNTALTEYLLNDPRLDPGIPNGTAQNLLTIVRRKQFRGIFGANKNLLMEKLANSTSFCDQLMRSNDLAFKKNFISLHYLASTGVIPSHIFESNNIHDLNDQIGQILPRIRDGAPPSYQELFQAP